MTGNLVWADAVKKTRKGHQGLEKIVRWMKDTINHIAHVGSDHTCGRFEPIELLGFVASKLNIIPQKMPSSKTFKLDVTSQRSALELSRFLGMPDDVIKQAVRVTRNASAGNTRKLGRIVLWLTNVVKHIAQLVNITNNAKSDDVTWFKLLEFMSHKLNLKPTPITTTTQTSETTTSPSSTRTTTTSHTNMTTVSPPTTCTIPPTTTNPTTHTTTNAPPPNTTTTVPPPTTNPTTHTTTNTPPPNITITVPPSTPNPTTHTTTNAPPPNTTTTVPPPTTNPTTHTTTNTPPPNTTTTVPPSTTNPTTHTTTNTPPPNTTTTVPPLTTNPTTHTTTNTPPPNITTTVPPSTTNPTTHTTTNTSPPNVTTTTTTPTTNTSTIGGTIKPTDMPPIDVISPIDVTSVNSQTLIKDLLSRWASEIKRGDRREAQRTLALLVNSTTNAKKTLPEIAKFLCASKVEVGSEVVEKTKTWKNSGVSRHARKRGTIIKIDGDVAVVKYQDTLPAYDILDTSTGRRLYAVPTSDVKRTSLSKLTKPGGNNKSHTFKSKSPVLMKNSDGSDSPLPNHPLCFSLCLVVCMNISSSPLLICICMCVPVYLGKWVNGEVIGKTTRMHPRTEEKAVCELLNTENVYLTEYKIKQAQKYARKYRPNKTPPPVLRKEYKVILPSTMDHFEKWILSPSMTEPLKMREKHIAAGHVVGLKQPRYSTFPRYETDCKEKGVVPLPREIYTTILGMKEFINLKQDDCMCPKCMTYGWRGIIGKRQDFFTMLRKLGKGCGLFDVDTDPVTRLSERLEAAWNHMRTTYVHTHTRTHTH